MNDLHSRCCDLIVAASHYSECIATVVLLENIPFVSGRADQVRLSAGTGNLVMHSSWISINVIGIHASRLDRASTAVVFHMDSYPQPADTVGLTTCLVPLRHIRGKLQVAWEVWPGGANSAGGAALEGTREVEPQKGRHC